MDGATGISGMGDRELVSVSVLLLLVTFMQFTVSKKNAKNNEPKFRRREFLNEKKRKIERKSAANVADL